MSPSCRFTKPQKRSTFSFADIDFFSTDDQAPECRIWVWGWGREGRECRLAVVACGLAASDMNGRLSTGRLGPAVTFTKGLKSQGFSLAADGRRIDMGNKGSLSQSCLGKLVN
jgi:hypothetical protein